MKKIYVISNKQPCLLECIRIVNSIEGAVLQGCSNCFVDLFIYLDQGKPLDLLVIDFDYSQEMMQSVCKLFRSVCKVVYLSSHQVLHKSLSNSGVFEVLQNVTQLKSYINLDLTAKSMGNKKEIKSNFLFVKGEKGCIIRVDLESIIYVESDKNYIHIHSVSQKSTINFSLSAFEHHLPENFIRVHRSFIINSEKIKVIETNKILLEKEIRVPVGHSFRKIVANRFTSMLVDPSNIAN
jgi:two-component system LytT family response regulator